MINILLYHLSLILLIFYHQRRVQRFLPLVLVLYKHIIYNNNYPSDILFHYNQMKPTKKFTILEQTLLSAYKYTKLELYSQLQFGIEAITWLIHSQLMLVHYITLN